MLKILLDKIYRYIRQVQNINWYKNFKRKFANIPLIFSLYIILYMSNINSYVYISIYRKFFNLPSLLASVETTWINSDCLGEHVNSHKCRTKLAIQEGQRSRKLAANKIFLFRISTFKYNKQIIYIQIRIVNIWSIK